MHENHPNKGRGSPLFGARSRDHRRPYVLKNSMSATCASFTAGVLRRARINDKPAPAETRARVLSILSILMPREKRALLASSNLSRPVRLDLVHRGGKSAFPIVHARSRPVTSAVHTSSFMRLMP